MEVDGIKILFQLEGENAVEEKVQASLRQAKKAYIEHEIKAYLFGSDTEQKAKLSGRECLAKNED